MMVTITRGLFEFFQHRDLECRKNDKVFRFGRKLQREFRRLRSSGLVLVCGTKP